MFARALQKLSVFKRFAKAKRGSAAVEFAIVAMPFFLLTIGLAEISMIGFAQTTLDMGVSEAAREIRSGRAQLGGWVRPRSRIRSAIRSTRWSCWSATASLHRRRHLRFVHRRQQCQRQSHSERRLQRGGMGYTPGVPSSIVVVRAYYR